MEDRKALYRYLDDNPWFTNPLGVSITYYDDTSYTLCCDYPGIVQPELDSIELMKEVRSLRRVANLLQISTVEELFKVSPIDLLTLYEKGRMNLVCLLDSDRDIHFLKYKRSLWARDSDLAIHKVATRLNRPEDFLQYTIQYYSIERPVPSGPPDNSLDHLSKRY